MSFHELTNMTVQNTYEVRRTGLNRLSIIVDGEDGPVSNPQLMLCGVDAILLRDDNSQIVLPDFPQEYIPELLQGRSVLIGEREVTKEVSDTLFYSVARTPVKRFYEALVSISKVMEKTKPEILPSGIKAANA